MQKNQDQYTNILREHWTLYSICSIIYCTIIIKSQYDLIFLTRLISRAPKMFMLTE